MSSAFEFDQLRKDYIDINSRYELLFEKSLNPIAVTDQNFKFTEVNHAFCEMLGYSKSEVLSLSMPEVSYKDSADKSIYLIRQMIDGEIEDFSIMKKYKKKDGSLINANTAVKALRDESGAYEGAIASIEILTMEKLRNMQSSIDQLEDFAQLLSHDLRAPLTNVMGCISLLKEDPVLTDNEESRKILNTIAKSSERMSNMISEILNNAMVSQECETDMLGEINLRSLVADVLENLQFDIDRLNATIHYGNLFSITGYYSQLVQLFQNLISNSLKFRRQGVPPKIKISATKMAQGIKFRLTDNGIGIPEEALANVFTKFYRVNHENQVGFGLGLSTCKSIIREYGGSISIDSEVNQGTTITFTLIGHM